MTRKDARKDRRKENRPQRKFKRIIIISICTIAVISTSLVARYYWPTTPVAADQEASAQSRGYATSGNGASAPINRPSHDIVAIVNGEKISRQQLATECLRHYGKDVLQLLTNRYLIQQHCDARDIEVSRKEIDKEVGRLASRFQLPVERWFKLLRDERGINPDQYRMDIIWPTLALKKLTRDSIKPSAQEIQKRYEAEYGRAVECLMIGIHGDLAKAKEIHQLAVKNPKQFGRLAKDKSDDPSSASVYGVIPPIRRYVGKPEIEKIAFALKVGEISQVIQVENQYIILKCQRLIPALNVPLERIKPQLEELIRDRKLRSESSKLFTKLQEDAKFENVMNDPIKSKQMPGVAALINGQQISIRQLAEQCIVRHQKDVVDGMVNRLLIVQALRKSKLTITQQDIDNEIADAAGRMIRPKKNGQPNIEGWLKLVMEEPGVTKEIYIHDSVWPSAALKKLAMKNVKVTNEDMKKGFDANYGKKIRCQAIVLHNQKQAADIWNKARSNPTAEYFGKLAAEYSIDPTTKTGKGEIPPIKQNGGRPMIEAEAFRLRPNEISGILQSRGKFVILRCIGYTKPVEVSMKEVESELYQMIYEKKLSRAMARKFDRLQLAASITNYVNPKASKVPTKSVTDGTRRTARRGTTIPQSTIPRR